MHANYAPDSAGFVSSALCSAIRFPAPFVVDEFGCHRPAFSTLSTPSTVLVLNLLGKFLDLALLSFLSALVCDLPLQEGCNRVTYAPESTRRLSGHISPQPSSVPIQARQ